MPAAVRAERSRPGDVDGLPAADTLHAALTALVDGLVRTRLAEAGVDPDRRRRGSSRADRRAGFDAPRRAWLDELDRALDAWHADAASGAAVRVCFRLSHLHELEEDEPDATGLRRPTTRAAVTPGCSSSCCSRSTSPACWSPPPTSGGTAAPRCAAGPTTRRSACSAGLGRAARLLPRPATTRCASPGRSSWCSTPRARTGSSPTRRCSSRPATACCCRPGGGEPQSLGLALEVHTRDPISPVLRDEAADLASPGRLPVGAGARRPGAHRGRAGRPGPGQGAAGPDARALGLPRPERLDAGLAFLARGGGTMTAGRRAADDPAAAARGAAAAGDRHRRRRLDRRPARR